MALSRLEQMLVDQYTNINYPRMEPEPEPPAEGEMPFEPYQVAQAGPGVTGPGGAAFGIYPGAGRRRPENNSDIGQRMLLSAPDFAAGGARGFGVAAGGIGGDIQKLYRFARALATDNQGGTVLEKFERAGQAMEGSTFLPSSEDLDKNGYTIPGTSITFGPLPPTVPEGATLPGLTNEQRNTAAGAGQFVGELVGDPVAAVKIGKGVVRGAAAAGKALAPKAGEIADQYMGRMGLKLYAAPEEYRGSHRAPMGSDDVAAPGFDLTPILPEDIYGPKAAQYYGHFGGNDPMDRNTARIIKMMRAKPDMDVMVFRAVPANVPSPEINRGDWVTINRDYAQSHGESVLDGKYRIISKMVKAKDIYTDGNSIHEWGYDPVGKEQK